MTNQKVPLEVSVRHVHLCKEDFEKLFGKDYELKIRNKISQPGQFASEETISIISDDSEIKNVRVVGPLRKQTQVEISRTDAFTLKINAPLKLSGDLEGSAGITLKNGNKTIKINNGLIIAKRHLHISDIEADKLKLKVKNNQKIKIKVLGERELVFDEVIVRKGKDHKFAIHLDSDEGNAAGISGKMFGEIII